MTTHARVTAQITRLTEQIGTLTHERNTLVLQLQQISTAPRRNNSSRRVDRCPPVPDASKPGDA